MKIVSLSPSLTETLIHLGAGDELRGITDFCPSPGREIERLGSPKALNLSKVDRLEPDWVLADARENRPEEIQAIQKRRRVKVFDVRQLGEVCDAVAEIGRLVERREEAKRLNDSIHAEMAENERLFRGRERKRAIVLLWDQPYLTVNFDSYPSRLIDASGGVNVFRKEPLREFPVELEEMIEQNPEVLLLPKEPAPFRERHVKGFRRYRIFSHIPIHLVDGKLVTHFGGQTAGALRALREIFESVP